MVMNRRFTGFSLIELIMVIIITAILGTFISRIISRPVEGFVDISRRAELVDIAEVSLRKMSREIRLALPNSVRLRSNATANLQVCAAAGATTCSVEILRTLDGGRYRARTGGAGPPVCGGGIPGDRLDFSTANDCFEVLGDLQTLPTVSGGATQDDCLAGTSDCLAIYNTGQPSVCPAPPLDCLNAYCGCNIAGIQAAAVNALTFDITGANGLTQFPVQARSPRQRFHIVDMPVSFVCDPNAGTITRQADYTITPAQVSSPGGTVSVLADNITSCVFTYNQGTNSRTALLTVNIVISTTDTQGSINSVNLIEQIQVPNIP